MVNTNSVNALLPGISLGETLDANYPPAHVREANFTIEQPFRDGSVFRVTYVFTHGYNLDQNYQYNNAPSTYVWETATGTTPPTGTYASTATRPYDQTTWGGNVISMKTGWSNDSALQLNYQRPFKNGFGYQIFYVYSRAFRVGGNTFRDNMLYPAANFAPGVLPAGMDAGTILNPSQALNRYENYKVDTAIPDASRDLQRNRGIAGRQGQALPGERRQVPQCAGGRLPVRVRRPGVVAVLPGCLGQLGRHQPGAKLRKFGARSTIAAAASATGVSVVQRLHLADRDQRRQERDLGPSGQLYAVPRSHQQHARHGELRQQQCDGYAEERDAGVHRLLSRTGGRQPVLADRAAGPFNYITDMSLYKVFSITERVKLRVNVDAFNAFNIQGRVNPNTTDGIESLQTSYWTPRQIQLTGRISF